MEKEQKKLFFIQLMENFFETEDLLLIEELALEKKLNSNDIQTIYLKLILKSIKHNGLIQFDKLTPQNLKAYLHFKTGEGYSNDLKKIDTAIQFLEELKLISTLDNAIFVKKALIYAMNKNEDSQRRFEERRKEKILIQQFQLKELNTLTETDKEEMTFNNHLANEWLPGLVYCGFTTADKKKKFVPIFEELFFDRNITIEEISTAMKKIIKRALDTDAYSKIEHPENYLLNTIYSIVVDEIRVGLELYDPILTMLWRRGYIQNFSDQSQFFAVFNFFERKGYTKAQILDAVKEFITKFNRLDDENINSSISFFHKELDFNLKKLEKGIN